MHHLEIKDLYVSYDKETVLKGVTLSSDKGEVVSLIGPSGSGKSTLLRALIGLTPPSQGQVLVGGEAIDYSSRKSLRTLREEMAIVFQQYNLFQNMTVLRNVSIAPVKIQKRARREAEQDARVLLEKVGMADKQNAYPDELSGGQQQRVAIARALVNDPSVILADEPTGNLDQKSGRQIMELFRELNRNGSTILLITHDNAVADAASRIVHIDDGQLTEARMQVAS